jgi:hypothetical protein
MKYAMAFGTMLDIDKSNAGFEDNEQGQTPREIWLHFENMFDANETRNKFISDLCPIATPYISNGNHSQFDKFVIL